MRSPEHLDFIADIILERKKQYSQLVVVVSAMGEMTDFLLGLGQAVHPQPPKRELDMLVSIGERASASLLAMALDKKGQRAISFTGSQAGILTTSEHHEAKIVDVRPHRLFPFLQKEDVVIVAGFQGVSAEREITTLGRGGSDTTAVALGIALGASLVEFYKDVEGVFPEDPKGRQGQRPFSSLSYEKLLSVLEQGKKHVLHKRAIQLAARANLPLKVRSFADFFKPEAFPGTYIGEEEVKREAFTPFPFEWGCASV